MISRFWILIVGLLAVGFVAKSVDAIKCYQCDNCADDEEPDDADLKECKKVGYIDSLAEILVKVTGAPGVTKDQIVKQMTTVMAADSKNPFANDIKEAMTEKPASCYKMELTHKKTELVYRGCGHDTDAECETHEGIEICFCKDDGCNGDEDDDDDDDDDTDTNSASFQSVTAVLFVAILSIIHSLLNA